ncbi:glucokinase [Defluviimonas sp. WL0002]|uniref:Glucokinase n=1 Tax=Albidovulum marisflavi TaxID=2984159 RepID=A0ABT2ZG38_9RHOB|nr:glucokinase [Defluviimonas sp. WL0002]MCV2870095.1 glucokinase [Defluviimonas sp. WL0002]
MTSAPMILADVGGTNTRVALARYGQVDRGSIRRYPNAGHSGLEPILSGYLSDMGEVRTAGACVAAAGPVEAGRAEMTNLSWVIESQGVADATGAGTVAILNDLQAQGHALGHIAQGASRPILQGERAEGQVQLVIGIGTGFNAAPVYDTASGRIVAASESGHVSLPIRTDADLRLASQVGGKHGFTGVEEVLSGRGLEQTFSWVAHEAGSDQTRDASSIMQGIASNDDLARAAGGVFVRMLGMVAGNLALTFLPFGGIYLIGGVARAFAPHLEDLSFREAFFDKGRFSQFMERFPVSVVEDDYAALTGCAMHLTALMRRAA